MAKLYFRHGTVGSAKTMNLLAVAHNYRSQGKSVCLLKPALDTRFGRAQIRSRSGLEHEADLLLEADTRLDTDALGKHACVLVDEAQFVSPAVVDQLRELTRTHDVPVICYGLRTDFRTHLFEGSRRLLEVADAIEEVKVTCQFCNRKAILNLKHVDGRAVADGPSVELGAEERYLPVCYSCYVRELTAAGAR